MIPRYDDPAAPPTSGPAREPSPALWEAARDEGNSSASPVTDSPFGTARPGSRRRVVGLTLFGAALLAALGGVYAATRTPPDASASAAGHDHGAAPTATRAMPVTLTPDAERRIGVTYAVATEAPLAREVRAVAQVTFDERRVKTISPKIDGWVERLYIDFTGQSVRAGEPLFTIYSPMLVTAQEELLLAKRLASDVSGGTPDAVRGAADLLASSRRRLAYWDISDAEIARIERTGEVRKSLTIASPASGVVVEKNVLAGQRIMGGEALYRVADLSTVWLEGDVFERDLAAVRVGQLVTADFEALPGQHRTGRITYVYPTLNPDTRTARVRVELANPALAIKPGMYATLRIIGTGRDAAVLSVPRSALLATGDRNLVFIKRGSGLLEPREVVPGFATDERIEIVRGLVAGDTVVASATFLVDAESNLGTAFGGMGNMPGMEMSRPVPAGAAASKPPVAPAPSTKPMPDMPGMDHSRHQE